MRLVVAAAGGEGGGEGEGDETTFFEFWKGACIS